MATRQEKQSLRCHRPLSRYLMLGIQGRWMLSLKQRESEVLLGTRVELADEDHPIGRDLFLAIISVFFECDWCGFRYMISRSRNPHWKRGWVKMTSWKKARTPSADNFQALGFVQCFLLAVGDRKSFQQAAIIVEGSGF